MRVGINDDVELVRQWSRFYRSRGWNPLPMRRDGKRPMCQFAGWWEAPAPPDLFEKFETTGIQVMTGRHWRLLVIDVDGQEAMDWFYAGGRRHPRTWVTHSGGDGLHVWFVLPERRLGELPKVFLWKGGGEHSGVERLCDRSLIVVPPTIHPETGRRYRFRSKGESPATLALPAACPEWVLALPAVERPRPAPPPPRLLPLRRRVVGSRGRYRAVDVLLSIPDKVALAESWGLKVSSRRANPAGWCSCHAISREDRRPSASISAATGRYWEPGEPSIGLFDLAVRLGVYADWREAVDDLGARFGAEGVARA